MVPPDKEEFEVGKGECEVDREEETLADMSLGEGVDKVSSESGGDSGGVARHDRSLRGCRLLKRSA